MFKTNVGGIDRVLRIVVEWALIAGFFLNPDATIAWRICWASFRWRQDFCPPARFIDPGDQHLPDGSAAEAARGRAAAGHLAAIRRLSSGAR